MYLEQCANTLNFEGDFLTFFFQSKKEKAKETKKKS